MKAPSLSREKLAASGWETIKDRNAPMTAADHLMREVVDGFGPEERGMLVSAEAVYIDPARSRVLFLFRNAPRVVRAIRWRRGAR